MDKKSRRSARSLPATLPKIEEGGRGGRGRGILPLSSTKISLAYYSSIYYFISYLVDFNATSHDVRLSFITSSDGHRLCHLTKVSEQLLSRSESTHDSDYIPNRQFTHSYRRF